MRKRIVASALAACVTLSVPMTAMSADRIPDTPISATAQSACEKYGAEYGICPEFLMAVCETESCGERYATNGSCKGLMQVSERWHKDRMNRLGVYDLYNEEQNVHCGADLFAELFAEYEDPALVLDVYNGNSAAEYNANNGILSPYASKILARSRALEELHGKV